jgi:hypothetical protein
VPTAPTAATGLPVVLRAIGTVIAPATVATSLLFYFGARHAYWFCRYFGVHYSALEFTPQDYLTRSADGLFVPIATAALTSLAVVSAIRLLKARLGATAWTKLRSGARPVVMTGGGVLVTAGVVAIVYPAPFYDWPGLPGLGLACGILLLTTTYRDAAARDTGSTVRAAGTFALVCVGLFWAVTDYSAAVGQQRAGQYQRALPAMPEAVLFSAKPLGIDAEGVAVTRCQEADAAYQFRYDGLVLVLKSGGQFLLLPKSWTPRSGVAIVLPDSAAIRLEFTLPGGARERAC